MFIGILTFFFFLQIFVNFDHVGLSALTSRGHTDHGLSTLQSSARGQHARHASAPHAHDTRRRPCQTPTKQANAPVIPRVRDDRHAPRPEPPRQWGHTDTGAHGPSNRPRAHESAARRGGTRTRQPTRLFQRHLVPPANRCPSRPHGPLPTALRRPSASGSAGTA